MRLCEAPSVWGDGCVKKPRTELPFVAQQRWKWKSESRDSEHRKQATVGERQSTAQKGVRAIDTRNSQLWNGSNAAKTSVRSPGLSADECEHPLVWYFGAGWNCKDYRFDAQTQWGCNCTGTSLEKRTMLQTQSKCPCAQRYYDSGRACLCTPTT